VKLLHTSDWHIGRSFHRADLLAAQAAFLDHLVETVRAERVDAVVVAGDVYDRALPPTDAVDLVDDGLARLVGTGAAVLVLSGNHDSATRLGFGSRVLAAGGLHLRTRPAGAGQPVVLDDEHGPVALYGIPYLEPEIVHRELLGTPREPEAGEPGRRRAPSHAAVLQACTALVRADLARRPGARSVVAAHAFVVGGVESTSERDISVGGVAHVPAGLFDGFSYTALGHLHGAQAVAPTVRYSGSPLPYSFSEASHTKGSWLVELGPAGVRDVTAVPAPAHRPLAQLRGDLADLLADPRHAAAEGAFVAATLTDAQRPLDAMRRLQDRFPHAVTLEFDPQGAAGSAAQSYAERVRGRDDLEIAESFVAHVRGAGPTPGEVELLRDAFTAVRQAEAA
jgi:DNA repair protein SbcD/Mre11